MYSKISIDFDFKQFLDAKYTDYETISIRIWNDSNKNSDLTQLKSPLPETYCWENTKMKQILWDLTEIDVESLSKILSIILSDNQLNDKITTNGLIRSKQFKAETIAAEWLKN